MVGVVEDEGKAGGQYLALGLGSAGVPRAFSSICSGPPDILLPPVRLGFRLPVEVDALRCLNVKVNRRSELVAVWIWVTLEQSTYAAMFVKEDLWMFHGLWARVQGNDCMTYGLSVVH